MACSVVYSPLGESSLATLGERSLKYGEVPCLFAFRREFVGDNVTVAKVYDFTVRWLFAFRREFVGDPLDQGTIKAKWCLFAFRREFVGDGAGIFLCSMCAKCLFAFRREFVGDPTPPSGPVTRVDACLLHTRWVRVLWVRVGGPWGDWVERGMACTHDGPFRCGPTTPTGRPRTVPRPVAWLDRATGAGSNMLRSSGWRRWSRCRHR